MAPNLILESRANYGIMFAHHLEMESFNAHLPSFEVTLSRATYGKQHWETIYNYPVTGINYWNAWLGDKQTLGQAHAMMPFISFPLVKNGPSLLNFRLSAGLGYLTQRFDRLENYRFIAIGSHLNAAINMMVEYRWSPTDHLQMFGGLQVMHFSNGSIKTPNYGLNIISLGGGVAIRLNRENQFIKRAIKPSLTMYEFDGKKFLEVKVGSMFGVKSIGESNESSYLVMASYFNVVKSVSYKSKLGISIDLSYDGSDARMLESKDIELNNGYQLIMPGVALTYEMVLSRLSFPVSLGFYLGNQKQSEGISYYKIGVQYLVYRNLFAALTLKTHYARADYVALGLGYRFKVKHYL